MTDLIIPSRRSFLFGAAASLIVAPAIVRAASLMPVRAPRLVLPHITDYVSENFTTFDILWSRYYLNQDGDMVIERLRSDQVYVDETGQVTYTGD